MPFGINLLCLSGQIGPEHAGQIERIAALGYDGVEIPVLAGDPEDYRGLATTLDDLGLRRTGTAVIPDPDASPVSPDPDVRARGRAHLDWALDCAEALGAEVLGGPFHAPIGHFTGSGATEDELARGAEAHRRMAQDAQGRDIALALEPLNRFETYFLNTMEQAWAYAERVDHPGFGIMYDTFHANIEERSQPDAITHIGRHMSVLHVSENDRGVVGRGQIDFSAIFRAAKGVGFDGWIVVEAFGTGLPELAAATRVWRPLFPDFETLFAESLETARNGWATA